MLYNLLASRELIWRLIVRDISVRYRQSLLGYFWAIVPAVAAVLVLSFLKSSGSVQLRDTSIPYLAYALWGISVWQLFAGCLTGATASLASAGSLVTKIHFPKDSLVVASMGAPIFDFLVRLAPLAAVFIWTGVTFRWQWLMLPFALAPMILLCLGFGFVLSIANLAFRDVGNSLTILLMLGMFVTPVLYPPPLEWPYVLMNYLNPVSPLLIASQDLVAFGRLTLPVTFVFSTLGSCVVCLAGWRFFNIALPRITQLA